VTDKRLSKSENDATAEGQTCGIARFLHLSEKAYLRTVLSYNLETVADRPTNAMEAE